MNTSQRGLEFILGWEGSRSTPYDDGGAGVGNCTVGVGHLIHLGPCTPGELAQPPLTDAQIVNVLRQDVQRFEDVVRANATVSLNQNQFDALVDFCFNTGGGYPRVWDAVNNGGDVCAVLVTTATTPAWAHAALVRRRMAECALFMEEGDNEMKVATWWTGKKFSTGRYEINLTDDFGPADSYLMVVTLTPDSVSEVAYYHGDFKPAAKISGRAATFVLIPGQYGTAPFDITGQVTFATVAATPIK